MTRRTVNLAGTHLRPTPNADDIRARLPDLAESLRTAAFELARDCTLEKSHAFLAKLKGAETTVQHLCRALSEQ
jgi:hypothetical protein